VHVEVLDPKDDVAVPEGTVGEIVVTAGENPLLPLVRYRTGDYGRLMRFDDGTLGIADLEGRQNTRFRAADGSLVPCVELTQQLQAHGAQGWSVEQSADGRVRAVIVGGDDDGIRIALNALLSSPIDLHRVERLADLGEGKPRRYRSAVAD
jgi:phenylacetate-CoA ligase